jgi:hypothetical protein
MCVWSAVCVCGRQREDGRRCGRIQGTQDLAALHVASQTVSSVRLLDRFVGFFVSITELRTVCVCGYE